MEEKSYNEIEQEFVRNVQQEVKDVMRKGKKVFAVIGILGALVLLLSIIL